MELPIPDSVRIPAYAAEVAALRTSVFVNPVGYIQRPGRGPTTELEDYVEFDLELEDEEWLRAHPRMGEAAEPNMRLPRVTFERIIDLMEKANAAAKGPWHANETLPAADVLVGLSESLSGEPNRFPLPEGLALGSTTWRAAVNDVHGHWVARRKRLQKPLLRRFWTPPAPSDQHPHHTFRPPAPSGFKLKRTRRNELEVFRKLMAAHKDLQSNLELLQAVIAREEIKLNITKVRGELLEQQLYELTDVTGVRRVPGLVEEQRKLREANAAPQGSGPKLKISIKPRSAQPGYGAARAEGGEEEREGAVGVRPKLKRPPVPAVRSAVGPVKKAKTEGGGSGAAAASRQKGGGGGGARRSGKKHFLLLGAAANAVQRGVGWVPSWSMGPSNIPFSCARCRATCGGCHVRARGCAWTWLCAWGERGTI